MIHNTKSTRQPWRHVSTLHVHVHAHAQVCMTKPASHANQSNLLTFETVDIRSTRPIRSLSSFGSVRDSIWIVLECTYTCKKREESHASSWCIHTTIAAPHQSVTVWWKVPIPWCYKSDPISHLPLSDKANCHCLLLSDNLKCLCTEYLKSYN